MVDDSYWLFLCPICHKKGHLTQHGPGCAECAFNGYIYLWHRDTIEDGIIKEKVCGCLLPVEHWEGRE